MQQVPPKNRAPKPGNNRKLEWKPVHRQETSAKKQEQGNAAQSNSSQLGESWQHKKPQQVAKKYKQYVNKPSTPSMEVRRDSRRQYWKATKQLETASVVKRHNIGDERQRSGEEASERPQGDNLREYLKHSLSRECYECMVCFEAIQRSASVWMCNTCFVVLHLACIRKWSKSSKERESNQQQQRQHASNEKQFSWMCPACRKDYTQCSLEYFCFCGKQREPSSEPVIVPHSCGNICGKPLAKNGSQCPHTCSELCHPGPCPPCSAVKAPKSCRCGKEQIVTRCSEPVPEQGYSCGMTCGKQMKCGHYCEQVCHEGACEPCQVAVETKCYCGSEYATLPCYVVSSDSGESGFSCGRKCDRVLDCKNHRCQQICHSGPCESCKYLPKNWNTCACGQVSLDQLLENQSCTERQSCMDALPSCGQRCGRLLNCLLGHTCEKVCGHLDPCGPCTYEFELPCRCQNETIRVACSNSRETILEELVCQRVCGGRLSCKRHYCKRVCCPGNKKKKRAEEHFTLFLEHKEKIVNYLGDIWNSFSHTCEEKCNQLLNCGIHYCDRSCGHEGDCYPCGILLWEPLTCACGAERLTPPIRCGTPPPVCNRPCQRVRQCGHPCPDSCHFGDCPRCVVLVKKECLGGHGISRTLPCFVDQVFCGRVCGKILKCGIHTCKRNCHADSCDTEALEEETKGCSNLCRLPRKGCGHPCQFKCHPGTLCPNVPCEHRVTVTCPCGMRKEEGICGKLDDQEEQSNNLVRLECDESCGRLSRARAFADAVGILPSVEEKSQPPHCTGNVSYSDFLMEFCEQNMEFVSSFEQSLRELLQGRFGRRMKTQPLPRLYRAFVHELGELFGLETASVDNYPEKEMVISLPKDMENISIPDRLLSDVVKERMRQAMQERKDRTKRRLRIQLIGENQVDNATRKLEKLLYAHQGTYKILESRTLERAIEFMVELSTAERTASVLRSLEHKKPTVVAHPIATSGSS